MSVADYQCVKVGDLWHLTQEQAVPPPITRGGAYTSCAKWAEFKLGYERRRPTCPECAEHVATYERNKRRKAMAWLDQLDEPPEDNL